jgi:ATP-dependent exoDNAse (exonuclease V) alpha subunit
LRDRWSAEAVAAGYQPEQVVRAALARDPRTVEARMSTDFSLGTSSRTSPETSSRTSSVVRPGAWRTASIGPSDANEIATELLSARGLTAHASVFDRNDVLRAIAERLRGGAPMREVEQLADKILTLEHITPVGPVPLALRGRRGTLVIDCWTTAELLALEQRSLVIATNSADSSRNTHPAAEHVHAALSARPGLSGEQRDVVEQLCASDRSIDVLVAPAGAGKTTVLAACRDAWAASGIAVTGAAVAGRAAAELADAARIPSTTIAAILNRPRDHCGIPPGGIVVIDEAGMVGTRQLHELMLRAIDNRARLILVGDNRQLPEIDAGGLFAQLARDLPALSLAENRRQRDAWERAALAQLRTGKIEQALAAYAEHGRITISDDRSGTLRACVNDWVAARGDGGGAVMLASLRTDVAALNRFARVAVERAGELSGLPLVVDDHDYRVGDQIVCLRNNQRLGLTNGTRGTVMTIDGRARTLTMETISGEQRAIPARYLDQGYVTHGYALTVHKAQGLTTERVFAIIGDEGYQELAYTALSRGRTSNRLYITRTTDEWERTVEEPLVALQNTLALSRQQSLASSHDPPRAPARQLELGL